MTISAPNFAGIATRRYGALVHGFGLRDSVWLAGVTLIRQIHSDIVVDALDAQLPARNAGSADTRTEVADGARKNEPNPGLREPRKNEPNPGARGLEPGQAEPSREGDALVANCPDIVIGIKTADCVPILLVDPETGSIASVHAGWRGTARGIVAKTIRELASRWGTRPESLRAAVGPAIGGCCYEVGPEVARRFGIEGSGSVHLDLAEINRRQLEEAGVGNIWLSGECTFCSPERFYSFRREKDKAGRMLAYIGWQKHDGRAL